MADPPGRRGELRALAGLALVALLAGCATAPGPAPVPPARAAPQQAPAWWYAMFFIDRPPDAEPRWHVDLLLANEVVAPVLDRFRPGIGLWRFHRRAGGDDAGHRFSFIFYATPATADAVFGALGESRTLGDLVARGILRRVAYDSTERVERPDLSDTSDRSWPPQLQREWPHFIMGVSQTWLGLVRHEARAVLGDRRPLSQARLLAGYEAVERRVTQLWRDEGGHAFLHHLSALFGYRPVEVVERRVATY